LKNLNAFFLLIHFCLLSSSAGLQAQDLAQIGKEKPIRVSGSLNIQGGPYIYLGDGEPRNEPFWWQASGSPILSIYGWQLPFSFSYGSRNRSFNQPFNRFGVSPYYKWLTLHFGYRSIRMNPFVMSGLQFLGTGIEMNPKGFRFAAFYGRFAKPVAQDTLSSITPTPAFKRMGYGAKIGAGNRRSYVDLTMVKVYDDTTSIPSVSQISDVKPQDNLAVGLGGRVAIGRRVNFQFDVAGSILNRNLQLPLLDTIVELKYLKNLIVPRLGFQFLTAGQATLQYSYKWIGIKVQVRRIDPDYRSLAAYYQQTDMQSLTVEPTLRLKKNKIRISGSIGKQQDNLYKRKAFTSVRTIGSGNFSWSPNKDYNLNLTYSNYGVAQQAGLQVLNDTFRVAQNNRSIGFGQQISRTNKKRTFTFSMNATFQQLQDLNPYETFASGENKVWFLNLNGNNIRIKDNLSIQGGLNISQNQFSNGSYLLLGPTIGISKPLIKDKLQASGTLSYNKGYQAGASSGSTMNMYSSFRYQINKTHQFNLTLNILHNSTTFLNANTFTEIRFLAGYTLVFQSKS
jgi:hypothetical protein